MLHTAGKVLFFLFLGISFSMAQTRAVDSAEVKKLHHPWVTYTSARFETLFQSGSSLFVEYGTMLKFKGFEQITQDEYNSLNENYSSFIWTGYEHSFTKHWYAGASGKANFVNDGTQSSGSFFNRFNISHRGNIGKLFFYKEVAFEYLSYDTKQYRQEEGRFSPSISLGRQLKVKGKPLYVGVNYRAFVNFDFKDDKFSVYDKRKIDRTKLKLELSYGFLPHWYIGAYYMRDTEYYYILATFDEFNNMKTPDYKINDITEGVGFVLTYLLFKDNADKYITDLPVR